jgi:hypothetical protein
MDVDLTKFRYLKASPQRGGGLKLKISTHTQYKKETTKKEKISKIKDQSTGLSTKGLAQNTQAMWSWKKKRGYHFG